MYEIKNFRLWFTTTFLRSSIIFMVSFKLLNFEDIIINFIIFNFLYPIFIIYKYIMKKGVSIILPLFSKKTIIFRVFPRFYIYYHPFNLILLLFIFIYYDLQNSKLLFNPRISNIHHFVIFSTSNWTPTFKLYFPLVSVSSEYFNVLYFILIQIINGVPNMPW